MQRSLVLNGFMGSGKSAVGRSLARMAGVECVDLDEQVVQEAGKSIARIFQEDGEGAFRALERRVLQARLGSATPAVIAVGGGALLERVTRLAVLDRAVVVHLDASVEELWRRVQMDGGSRPLAAGASVEDLARMLELRSLSYAEAHESVRAEGRTPDLIAAEVLEIWRRDPVCVAAGFDSYSVEVGPGIGAARLGGEVAGASMGLLVTDTTVDGLHGAGVREAIARVTRSLKFAMTPGEEHKTPETLAELWSFALAAGADRSSRVVGFGGGVVTDVAGFLAATWMRGVPWVSVPTTLLGMVDASVGGKTAVDLPNAKNCVGAFWQPRRVLCDVEYLATEEPRRYSSGLAEVVKTALIGDADLFALLEAEPQAVMSRNDAMVSEIVRRCVATKARIVSQDAREGGIRAALNLGHTIGHTLEAYGGYGALMHGEAVSLGLVAAMRLGERLGLGDAGLTRRVVSVLNALGLPTDLSTQPLAAASRLLSNDKKRGGNAVRFVFCPEPGRVVFKKLGLLELQELTPGLA